MMKKALLLFAIFYSSSAVSVPGGASGEILSINIKETGYILITLKSSHANTENCASSTMVAIANNHIAKKEILSIVLSAFATKRLVNFWISGCYEYYGTSFSNGITVSITD